jgi:glyoxylase-like metal-dependent hydrolase (beta-lactamase superfamily II)
VIFTPELACIITCSVRGIEMLQLTPELLVMQSRSLIYNTGAFIADGAAWLIDPGTHPDEINALAEHVQRRGVTIHGILLTHYHWDHIFGPERLPHLPVAAHADFAATLAANLSGTLRQVARWEQRFGYTRATPFLPPRPEYTLVDGATVPLGRRELQIIHIPGHAPDQIAVYEPETATLWAADTLSDQEIPYVSDSLARYIATLERLSLLTIRALAPGHGAPTTDPAAIRARLAADQAYLAELHSRVARAVAAGAGVEATVVACAMIPLRYPDQNAVQHRLNVESAYIELGGPADPTRVGWSRTDLVDE